MSKILRARHFLLLTLLSFSLCTNLCAQEKTITANFKNATLKQVFNSIEKQTSYRFSYRNAVIDNRRDITISMSHASVVSVLNEALRNRNLEYVIISSRSIVISDKQKSMIDQRHTGVNQKVSGVVKDASGEPIIGASVIEKGVSNNGTITNTNGEFTLSVKSNAILEISYIGYVSQTVKAYPGKIIVIKLEEATKNLNEVVVVGYGKQKLSTVTGSVAQIKSDKLTVAPIANVTNMLGGQLPGLISKQTSGIPGSDDASLSIRGFGSPLVIVDGIESSFNNIDANEIESISILKDGAASIYGARAGNGVILVTTKRGTSTKPTITVNTSYTLQGCTKVLKPGSSAQRAAWERESWLNAGKDPSTVPYSEEDIQKYEDGTDPNYLNTDWYDAVIRKWSPQQNHNVSIQGGNDFLKYYGYFGYNDQETIIKHAGGQYERYNFQSNVDAKLSNRITATFDMMYVKEHRHFAAGADGFSSNNNFWGDLIYGADPRYPLTLPDESKLSYAGITYGSPVFATNANLCGYRDNTDNLTQVKGGLQYDFKYIQGLNAKAVVIYRNTNDNYNMFRKQEKFYTYNNETQTYTYARSSQDPKTLSLSNSLAWLFTQQYSLNYDRTFDNKHHITGLFMFESIDSKNRYFDTSRSGFVSTALGELFAGDASTASNNSSTYEEGRASWIGRLNYSYMDRYLIETILRADASSKFDKDHRWGYFPSVSLGWVISEESFMKSFNFIDNLKLRLSYGKSGYDGVGAFKYLTGYGFDGTYTIGDNLVSGLYPTGLANPTLTWEKMTIYNAGLDFSLYNHNLYGALDFFYRKRRGIPGSRVGSLPSTFGAELPQENINSINTKGFELKLGTTGKWNDLIYDISGNISWSRAKWGHYEEADYADEDQLRLYKASGRYTDRRIGYVADGLFTSQDEINSLSYTFDVLNNNNSSLRPGDVKYKDLNGDNKLNWRDEKEIGKGAMPHWMYGFNCYLNYKGFDLSALFQGAFDYTTYIDFETYPSTELKYRYRWTEKVNSAHSLVPRPGGSTSTNWLYSDYRNHNTSYLRLKNMSIGYDVPKLLLTKIGIEKVRLYVAGTNIFTISSLHKYGVDPEMPEGYGVGFYYPQQHTISFGCNLTF